MNPLFDDIFPISTEQFSLEAIDDDGPPPNEDDEFVTLRLIGWDVDPDGIRAIRDIKEQVVVMVWARHIHDPRVPAYLAGWRKAVETVMQTQERLLAQGRKLPDSGNIAYMMPHDLIHPGVLDLKRPSDPKAFAHALLSAKQRLGAMLCGEHATFDV